VVSELVSVSILQAEGGRRKRKGWKHSRLQSDSNRLAKRAGRRLKMATEGQGCGHREDHKQQRKDEMDKELAEIRARMEELALRMHQDAKPHWVYEWPMKTKVKWPVKEFLAKRQRRLLKGWLRYVESLRDEEEMVHVCEPEAGRNLSDDEEERSLEDLVNCQVGRDELSSCQVGNRKRSNEDLVNCQEGSEESSDYQEGNEMRSLEDLIGCQGSSGESSNFQVGNEMGSLDLIVCQVGNRKFPNFQVGRGKEMRLSEGLMNSEESSDQQGVLT
jgi:hypothetical protein